MGAKGALAYENNEFTHIPAFKVEAVDTTAAGDTFCGGLCVALSEGKNLKDAIIFASKASSISVTRMGAQVSIPLRFCYYDKTMFNPRSIDKYVVNSIFFDEQ